MQVLTQDLEFFDPAGLRFLLLESGALLLRAQATAEDFQGLAQRCAEHWGALWELDAGESSFFSTKGLYHGYPVPLQGAFYARPEQPDLLWFYCARQSSEAEILLCDGIRLWQALPAELRAFLSERRLVYCQHYTQAEWQKGFQGCSESELLPALQAQGYICRWGPKQSLQLYFEAPVIIRRANQEVFLNQLLPFALQADSSASVCFAAQAEIPAELLAELRQIAAGLTQRLIWQAGDIVLLDNRRMLHGFGPAQELAAEIYLSMGQADFLQALL